MTPRPPEHDLKEKLCDHDALWFRLEQGERVDRPEDQLVIHHLAYGRYLKETGRISAMTDFEIEMLGHQKMILRRLAEVVDALVDIQGVLNERTGEGVSSLAIEDMAKGDPKIVTKVYGTPMTREQIDATLDAHGYAHRKAAELAMDGWQRTVEQLRADDA